MDFMHRDFQLDFHLPDEWFSNFYGHYDIILVVCYKHSI